jgi:hypothetical protein
MDEGDVAFDRETIAKRCKITTKTLRPILHEMLDAGVIVQAPRAYRNKGHILWTDGYCLSERLEAVLDAASRSGYRSEIPSQTSLRTGSEARP